MIKSEYQEIKNKKPNSKPVIQPSDLTDKSDRTLLYGYTTRLLYNRTNIHVHFHVYLKDNKIHIVTYLKDSRYNAPDHMQRAIAESNDDYIPTRLYPEYCDYEFCKILKDRGYDLPFNNWSDSHNRQANPFYGFTLEDQKSCNNCSNTDDEYCNTCEEYNKWFKK